MLRKVLTTIFFQLASYASVLGLYFTVTSVKSTTPIQWMIIGASVLVVAGLTFWEIRDHFTAAPHTYKSQHKINQFMCRWIAGGGRVAIFSRDMSWADGQTVRDLLFGKAARNELTIFVEKEIELTHELKAKGAQVITYGNLGYVPKSRFTIIDFDRDGARVAVGVPDHRKHVIQEFRSGAHPFFAVADDMVRLLLKACAK